MLLENPVLQPKQSVHTITPLTIKPSKFNNNLERFRYLCKDLPSPPIFIDFDFMFLISSCLARKIWIGTDLFPNLYIICVADPGVGKTVVADIVNKILKSLKLTELKDGHVITRDLVNLGPDAISVEKLIVRTQLCCESVKMNDPQNPFYEHSSCCFCLADELGMLFSEQTKRIVTFLMKMWDCKDYEGLYIGIGIFQGCY